MDINISLWRRQREHREASHGVWPRLTRDAAQMRMRDREREISQEDEGIIFLTHQNGSLLSKQPFL